MCFPFFPLPLGHLTVFIIYSTIVSWILEGKIICLLHNRSYMRSYVCVCWRRVSAPKRSWYLGSVYPLNERLGLSPLRWVECILGMERGMHTGICKSRVWESGKSDSWSTKSLLVFISIQVLASWTHKLPNKASFLVLFVCLFVCFFNLLCFTSVGHVTSY